jgi:hypothetical protein
MEHLIFNKSKPKIDIPIPNNDKYSVFLDRLVQIRELEEKKKKDFDEKYAEAMSAYQKETTFKFLKIINEDVILKNKIFEWKGDSFKNLVNFEESTINFFEQEINDYEGFTKINNKQFNLFSKVIAGTVTIKFEKEIDVNLIDLVSIIYEVGKYPKWFPFCRLSEVLNQPGKAKKVVYMISAIPVISDRDFLIYGFGINKLKEEGTILILCRSIEENSGVFVDEFKKKKNSKCVRGIIKIFGFEIKIINNQRVRVRGLLNSNPNIGFIPQKLINYVSQKVNKNL